MLKVEYMIKELCSDFQEPEMLNDPHDPKC